MGKRHFGPRAQQRGNFRIESFKFPQKRGALLCIRPSSSRTAEQRANR